MRFQIGHATAEDVVDQQRAKGGIPEEGTERAKFPDICVSTPSHVQGHPDWDSAKFDYIFALPTVKVCS